MTHNRKLRLLVQSVLVLATLLTACRSTTTPPPARTEAPPTRLPATDVPPTPEPTPLPDARGTAQAYLEAWQRGDYAGMYALLAPQTQAGLSAADFEQQYRQNLGIMSATAYTATVTGLTENGDTAQAQAHIIYATAQVGVLETDVTVPLRREAGVRWGVEYSPALIWPELVDGKQLYMVPFVPDRGIIYDRNGVPMAAQSQAYAVGLVPGEIVDHEAVQVGLGRLLGTAPQNIQRLYEFAIPDQYLALGEVSGEQMARYGYLFNVPGLRFAEYTSRFYYGSGDAAHVTGYTRFFGPDEVAEFQARGYAVDQRVGATGLEAWGEAILAGRNGGQLTLLDAAGQPLRAIAFGDMTPAQDIYTTVDFDLQQSVQFALGGYEAAAVVLRVDTGEVLALASSPSFDPNLFDPQNPNWAFADASGAGELNRATQDAYPAGSVFKIVTMSAGLTSGLFAPDTVYECDGTWEELGAGFVREDWLEGGHGAITLMEGLAGSCNPWFWHLGKALNDWNAQWLPDTARGFGLGQITGLETQDETPGLIPDPAWKQQAKGEPWEVVDSLNLAIGQGDVLVTPLQIARMVAAVANQGTLMQPQLVYRVAPPGGAPTFVLQPRVAGQLPLNGDQLLALQTAMRNVTLEPRGTARNRFRNFRIPIHGKTGTAETGIPGVDDPHAWFAGYTNAQRADRPDIAVAVWVSNRGQGSDIAAPIFRRIVEAYFGLPYVRYPWEEAVGVVATPEPTGTPEGTPAETPSPP